MAKKKVKDLLKDILNDDYEIEETDLQVISNIAVAKAMGRLAAKPRGNL